MRSPYGLTVCEMGPAAYYPLDERGFGDFSGNGRDGAAQGGLSTGSADGPLTFERSLSTDFDGADDYLTTGYATRRNQATNPRFAVDTAGWVNQSSELTTFERVTTLPNPEQLPGGAAGLGAAAIRCASSTGDANQYGRTPITLVNGRTYTVSMWFYVVAASAGEVRFRVNASPTTGGTTLGFQSANTIGAWERLSVTFTATGDSTGRVELFTNTNGTEWYVTGLLIEEAADTQPYFDGSAYVNDAGEWVDDPGGHVGWLGTAHASASDKGVFANGTTRTFCAWVCPDVAKSFHGLWGTDADCALLLESDNTTMLRVGGDDYHPPGAIPPGAWSFVALKVNAPISGGANTASISINGAAWSDFSIGGSIWNSSLPRTMLLGKTLGQSLDGKMAHVAGYERGLTAGELRRLMKAAKGGLWG